MTDILFGAASYIKKTENDPLSILLMDVEKSLKANMVEFKYPPTLIKKEHWKAQAKKIRMLNEEVLKAIDGRDGVYVILTAKQTTDFYLNYIGQAKADVIRQRIQSHLVWRNKDTPSKKFTGSKFDEVQQAVLWQNLQIAFSFVQIKPSALRHYVEECLIAKYQPEWNIHGTTLTGQTSHYSKLTWGYPKSLEID